MTNKEMSRLMNALDTNQVQVRELESLMANLQTALSVTEELSAYEDLYNELCDVKVELAKLYDTAFNA